MRNSSYTGLAVLLAAPEVPLWVVCFDKHSGMLTYLILAAPAGLLYGLVCIFVSLVHTRRRSAPQLNVDPLNQMLAGAALAAVGVLCALAASVMALVLWIGYVLAFGDVSFEF